MFKTIVLFITSLSKVNGNKINCNNENEPKHMKEAGMPTYELHFLLFYNDFLSLKIGSVKKTP